MVAIAGSQIKGIWGAFLFSSSSAVSETEVCRMTAECACLHGVLFAKYNA